MSKIFLIIYLISCHGISSCDLYLLGFANQKDGIGQNAISFMNSLNNSNIRIKLVDITPGWSNATAVSNEVKNIIENVVRLEDLKDYKKKSISVFTHIFWDNYKPLLDTYIKFAYSMVESDQVPQNWINILNKFFDAVIVPDDYFINVYKNSGIKIPIFVLPECLALDDFLSLPLKEKAKTPFVFGCSAGFWERKNHLLLIQAFIEEFGAKNEDVKLILHGRLNGSVNNYYDIVLEKIKEAGATNIEIKSNLLSREEYINFMKNLDCYVLISKGEGFSISPREAMAAGIPCILSNNTAHKTICNTNLVYSVDSNYIKDSVNNLGLHSGNEFNCSLIDVKKALRNIYQNYEKYLNLTKDARNWSTTYLPNNLRKKYLNMIMPSEIKMGKVNQVNDKFLNEEIFKQKNNGFFIDIGAHDGVSFSNTYFFEKNLNWNGICVEPNPDIYKKLKENRKCFCEQKGITNKPEQKPFLLCKGYLIEMYSGFLDSYDPRHLDRINNEIKTYGGNKEIISVDCITFQDLLDKYNINTIDLLSIDVEGGEEKIITSINFNRVCIKVIVVENNFNEEKIKKFLIENGFQHIKKIGKDDVYILRN